MLGLPYNRRSVNVCHERVSVIPKSALFHHIIPGGVKVEVTEGRPRAGILGSLGLSSGGASVQSFHLSAFLFPLQTSTKRRALSELKGFYSLPG